MLLNLKEVESGYGDLQILWGINLSVAAGKVTAIAGPNGAGKSTLLKTIVGTIPLNSGKIDFDGKEISQQSQSKRLRQGISFVPEGRLLFDDLTVYENLRLAAYMAGQDRSEFTVNLEKVLKLFPEINTWIQVLAGRLSGGQQQIVAVARAIVRSPRLILLDEPSVGLAPMVIQRIGDQLQKMKDSGIGVLIAEQNVQWLENVADEVVILTGGRITDNVSPKMLGSREFLRKAYLSV
jgi:branched-chain amino acid transport system ATP-binding protein